MHSSFFFFIIRNADILFEAQASKSNSYQRRQTVQFNSVLSVQRFYCLQKIKIQYKKVKINITLIFKRLRYLNISYPYDIPRFFFFLEVAAVFSPSYPRKATQEDLQELLYAFWLIIIRFRLFQEAPLKRKLQRREKRKHRERKVGKKKEKEKGHSLSSV